MSDPQVRIGAMDEQGVDRSILSLAAVNVWPWNPREARELSRLANEELAFVKDRYPNRFEILGTVPLEDPMEAPKELRYLMLTLGFPGVMIGANIHGKLLDEPAFAEFWEMADELGAVIFLHPAEFYGLPALGDFDMMRLLGFLFDTSLAVARMALSGHLERYQRVRIIVPHLGGVLPFVLDRLDRGYAIFEEARRGAPYAPSYYLKNLYYDTASFHRPALQTTLEMVGANRLLLGSDTPNPIGGMEEAVRMIRELGLSPEEESAVLEDNARKLFSSRDSRMH